MSCAIVVALAPYAARGAPVATDPRPARSWRFDGFGAAGAELRLGGDAARFFGARRADEGLRARFGSARGASPSSWTSAVAPEAVRRLGLGFVGADGFFSFGRCGT